MLATISAVSRQRDVSQISVRIIIDTLSERVVSLTVFGDTSICLGMADLAKHTKKVISLSTGNREQSGRDCMGLCVI